MKSSQDKFISLECKKIGGNNNEILHGHMNLLHLCKNLNCYTSCGRNMILALRDIYKQLNTVK